MLDELIAGKKKQWLEADACPVNAPCLKVRNIAGDETEVPVL